VTAFFRTARTGHSSSGSDHQNPAKSVQLDARQLTVPRAIAIIEADTIAPADVAASRLDSLLHRSFEDAPAHLRQPFTLVSALRDGEGMSCRFRLWRTTVSKTSWNTEEIKVPNHSCELVILGTGTNEVRNKIFDWKRSSQGGTSRAVYSAFVQAIASGMDNRSAAPPQLAGLYRSGPGRLFGTHHDTHAFVAGMEWTGDEATWPTPEWRNDLFERCDSTGALLTGAQKHGRPKLN